MDATLTAVARTGRGKNEARRLRRAGRLPAVVYGGEESEAVPVSVDPKALLEIFHSESGVNTLIGLSIDEAAANQVLVKEFQLDPISEALLHVDFYQLALDKAITIMVPVVLKGEPAGVKQQGGLVDFIHREVQVECMPTEIPEHIEVDISELMIGQGVRLREVSTDVSWLPVSDADTLLVHVIAPKVEEEEEAEEETAEAAAGEGGEPEDAKGRADEGDGSSES
jgi:large subunit ribosomal protein L25